MESARKICWDQVPAEIKSKPEMVAKYYGVSRATTFSGRKKGYFWVGYHNGIRDQFDPENKLFSRHAQVILEQARKGALSFVKEIGKYPSFITKKDLIQSGILMVLERIHTLEGFENNQESFKGMLFRMAYWGAKNYFQKNCSRAKKFSNPDFKKSLNDECVLNTLVIEDNNEEWIFEDNQKLTSILWFYVENGASATARHFGFQLNKELEQLLLQVATERGMIKFHNFVKVIENSFIKNYGRKCIVAKATTGTTYLKVEGKEIRISNHTSNTSRMKEIDFNISYQNYDEMRKIFPFLPNNWQSHNS